MLTTSKAPGRPLVLLAECQAILALDIVTELDEAGFAVAGPLTTCAELRAWTASTTPQAAILELALRDGSCLPEAMELARRGVSVAILTTEGRMSADSAITWIVGPVEPRLLVRFLRTRPEGSAR